MTATEIAQANHEDIRDAITSCFLNDIPINEFIAALHTEYPGEIDEDMEAEYRVAYQNGGRETAGDYLSEDDERECREIGIEPDEIPVTVTHRTDGPESMRGYDQVIMQIPERYKRLVACKATGEQAFYGYAGKEVKIALLGYW